ncbi:MAG: serine/threonine protein kinase, partial [Planctomycetes bacterium]|nr:serine/threonine protein kinase [Planctomycetota bacterium]
MNRASELQVALAACQKGLLSREKLLACAAEWFNEVENARSIPGFAPRPFEEFLLGTRSLDAAGLAQAQAAIEKGLPVEIGAEVRDALLDLNPPSQVCDWLLALPGRHRPAGPFEPLPREKRYRIGKEIARGGLGKVVEAVDGDLEREVAIKLVLQSADAKALERFVREARVTARLDHPNIVPVHDFGEMPGPGGKKQLFLCMKRVRGVDLGVILFAMTAGDSAAGARYSRMRLLRVFQDVCLGIGYAHSKGVLHRDLKPSNVMIGDFGETLIVDWGLAKILGEPDIATARSSPPQAAPASSPDATQLTLLGDVLGTPAYMSPEQTAGRIGEHDARSDVYALGALLYAILTWRSPVAPKDPPGPVLAPSALVASIKGSRAPEPVPPELDAIVAKAMAPDRENRYASALDLHQDVQLFLEGVQKRENGRREAAEHVARGRARLERFRELRGLLDQQHKEIARLRESIPQHKPLPEKKPLWEAEARLEAIREERIRCIAEFRAKLEAPGRLTLRTFEFTCDCLAPAREAGWSAEFEAERLNPWDYGGPLVSGAAGLTAWLVPRLVLFPAGSRFGHTPVCPRREVPGIVVWAAKFEERERLLVAGAERLLGVTPLV